MTWLVAIIFEFEDDNNINTAVPLYLVHILCIKTEEKRYTTELGNNDG